MTEPNQGNLEAQKRFRATHRRIDYAPLPAIAAIIEKYTKVPAATVETASHAYYDPNGAIPLADIQTLQTYFLSRGELDYKTAVDLTPYVDTTLVTEALKTLGVYAPPYAATIAATMVATTAP